jgi:NhaA family Na+:H+ antiporter
MQLMGTQPRRIERTLQPFRDFFHTEAAGGILLIAATAVALAWANSPWSERYDDLWHTTLAVRVGGHGLSKDLAHWINDGLMAIFFFVVGLEIKREVIVGELASVRRAALPIAAAAGGALVPALLYLALNAGSDASRGWGVPMATDIAFVLGILALLGDRVPLGLKVFLTALAIVDDIIAVLVVALFYTEAIVWSWLLGGAGVLALLLAANRLGVSRPLVYGLLGIGLWLAFIQSGVHATIAGVLLALTIPARTRIDTHEFLDSAQRALDLFRRSDPRAPSILTNHEQQSALQELESATEHIQSPMQRLEHVLHPWVAFAIMPLFALANAGVPLDSGVGDALSGSLGLGIIVGLVVGKQLGITVATLLMVRAGLADLPDGVTWRYVYGASCLAGIGFTMSLFIAGLAFVDLDRLTEAKVAILAASILSAAIGAAVLAPGRHPAPALEQHADEEPSRRAPA